ncbi:MAG: hypothetical protein FJW20_16805 [Acidimicrobiia bacterium]|nr:hypothetical protein [Acidimicrobiia bacterium]
MAALLVLVAAATHAVVGQFPLRSGCDTGSPAVATVHPGDRVEIRFALAGGRETCYKVSVEQAGRSLLGYLPGHAMVGVDEFERTRASAGTTQASGSAQPQSQQPTPALPAVNAAAQAAQLLKDNQPAEALRYLEAALRDQAGDADLLALAGLAAFHSDQIPAAVEHLERSIAVRPNPSVEALLLRARRESSGDQSKEKLFGTRFHLRFDAKDVTADQASQLVPLLDSELSRVAPLLGCQVQERIPTIIQSREAYRNTTGASEWSGGRYDGRIRVALLEPQPGEETRRALSHEIVHACLARTGNWPSWLHEGLAQKISGDTLSSQQRATVSKMARSDELPPLARMSASFAGMSSYHASIAYQVSLAAAELLYESYGPDGVRSLLQSPERLSQISLDLDRRLRE